jgi:3-deoxy-D-manno-octulosonate 8-phosphate phosphatase KdsC-like HAD superfamily phosphatase
MTTAIIAVIGGLLGVLIGFIPQFMQRKWQLRDLKREAYAELLRSISASYAQAHSGGGNFEDANILKATAVIELLAEPRVARAARRLQVQVDRAHQILRKQGGEAAKEEVEKANDERLELINLFQQELGIKKSRAHAQ